MKIDIARLAKDGADFEGEEPAEVLEWDPANPVMHPSSPLRYKLRARLIGTELLVTGSAWERFDGACTRCGDPVSFEARDDGICASFQVDENSEFIDLTEELRESILFALPNNPVCREDCPGICPKCYKKLADGACGCASDDEDDGWNAFSSLTLPEAPKKEEAAKGGARKRK